MFFFDSPENRKLIEHWEEMAYVMYELYPIHMKMTENCQMSINGIKSWILIQ